MNRHGEHSEVSQSLWKQTDDTDFLRTNGSHGHPSYAAVTERLSAVYGGDPFSLLGWCVMSGITLERLTEAGLATEYTGIDISPTILADCAERFPTAEWAEMSVTDLGYRADSFDVVHCRHLLEDLPYYETAVREMFRVARSSVMITFFQVPGEQDKLLRRETAGGYIWLNRYARAPLEALLGSLSTTVEIVDLTWENRINRLYVCAKDPDAAPW